MNALLLEKLKDMRILCVENEQGIREMAVQTLRYYFKEVYEACHGEEGYALYLEHQPEFILCDIQMPKMDGIALVKAIRKDDLTTKIIMLTAYSNEEYLMELINLSIDHFILKPLNLKKLNEALLKTLGNQLVDVLILTPELILNIHKRALVFRNESPIILRKREQEFLEMLYRNKKAITTYEQIEAYLWQDREMTEHALKSFIKELRSKIPVNIIKNIPQAGYILEVY